MADLNSFCKEWNGLTCNFDSDPKYNGQCTQLVKKWARRNKWAIPNGGGEDAYGYRLFRHGYQWVQNSVFAVPEPGDLVVFKTPPLHWVHGQCLPVGHVAIALPSNRFHLNSFDQNWTVKKKCSFVTHRRYKDVVGWLHWVG